MSIQNPTIPTATQAKGIDAHVIDLQMLLDTNLLWLTNGMGRAYTFSKVRGNGVTQFLPQIYLGTSKTSYFPSTPDNDKQGQNFITVGDATNINQSVGKFNYMSYPVSLIFSCNLKTIDSTLLLTEDFTEHLMEDVRQVVKRKALGKSYQLETVNETRDFVSVWSDWDIDIEAGKTGKQYLPMTYFRFDLVMTFREDCAGVSLNRCGAILQNLSQDDKDYCILPTYDMSIAPLTTQQETDVITRYCGGAGYANTKSVLLDGVNDGIEMPNVAGIDFDYTQAITITCWIYITSYHNGSIYSKWENTVTNNGFRFWGRSDGSLFVSISATASNKIQMTSPAASITLNAWNHVSMTSNGSGNASGVNMYINAALQTPTITHSIVTSSILNAVVPMLGNTAGMAYPFAGYMTEPRIWIAEQNQAFITDDENGGRPKAPEDVSNLILNPRFSNGLSQELYNNVRFPNDGTVTVNSVQTLNMALANWQGFVPT